MSTGIDHPAAHGPSGRVPSSPNTFWNRLPIRAHVSSISRTGSHLDGACSPRLTGSVIVPFLPSSPAALPATASGETHHLNPPRRQAGGQGVGGATATDPCS